VFSRVFSSSEAPPPPRPPPVRIPCHAAPAFPSVTQPQQASFLEPSFQAANADKPSAVDRRKPGRQRKSDPLG
jgi:hypothetical protein